ncbi:MAG TPA: DUF424 family protein [Euryarchaeota archaeon]|nr:DUF424 family protein [Euryarchaeota archaeon]
MKFYMKIYRVEREVIVAVCDEELHGRIFEEDEVRLEISKDFYGNELFSELEIVSALRGATIANLSGEKAVAIGIREGFIDRNIVLKVSGISHAQYARL